MNEENNHNELGVNLGDVLAPKDKVLVLGGDETIQHVGETGIVQGYRSASDVGGNPYDPFIEVLFSNGGVDHFWREELQLVQRSV
jgi:hypothetical protein